MGGGSDIDKCLYWTASNGVEFSFFSFYLWRHWHFVDYFSFLSFMEGILTNYFISLIGGAGTNNKEPTKKKHRFHVPGRW